MKALLPKFGWILVLALAGRELDFQVVDGSGKPVAGAKVKVWRGSILKFGDVRPRDIASTDTNGRIRIAISAKQTLFFTAPSHCGATAALAENGNVRVDWPILPRDRPSAKPQIMVTNAAATIIIPLMPIPIGQ